MSAGMIMEFVDKNREGFDDSICETLTSHGLCFSDKGITCKECLNFAYRGLLDETDDR